MRRVRSAWVMIVALAVVIGSDVGAAAQTAPSDPRPVVFTGRILCGDQVRPNTTAFGDGVARHRGGAWHGTATMSDPRLEGDYYLSLDDDTYTDPLGNALGEGTWRIENVEGAWQGSFTVLGFPDGTGSTVTTPLVGEGAYEGLTAIWESTNDDTACGWDVRGLIIAGDVPAAPEPFSGQGH